LAFYFHIILLFCNGVIVCLTLDEGLKLRELRRIFGPKWKEDVTGTWIKLCDEKLIVLCPVGVLIGCRRMNCTRHLAHISKERDAHKILAKRHLEDV
jgi:hypothetical protein